MLYLKLSFCYVGPLSPSSVTKLLIHTITQREKTAHNTLLKLLFFKEYTFQHTEELCSLCRVNGRGGGK